MASVNRFLGAFCVLALAAMACGVTVDLGTQPAAAPAVHISGPQQVATIVAQTLQAFTQQALSAMPFATASPTPSRLPVPVALSVSLATECYAGPSSKYGFVITLRPGTIAKVVGQDPADNYWVIEAPGYAGTVCWLSGQYAKVTGDTSSLPAPATPLASNYTLSEPRNLRASCSTAAVTVPPSPGPYPYPFPYPYPDAHPETVVTFRWTNTDPDQTGVRVYRNGWRIATLGAHASSYTESLTHSWRHGFTYGVQAFTRTAVSSIVSIELRRCR